MFFNRSVRKVKMNCHISFENNYYSVPSALVGQEVEIRWDKHILRIINLSEEVAIHKIDSGRGEFVTVREHLPSYKYYSETEFQAKYEAKMIKIGENAHRYFKEMLTKKESYWYRSMRTILGLRNEFGDEILELTLKRALEYKVLDIPMIKNIIKKKTYLLEKEPVLSKINITIEDLNDSNTNYERSSNYYLAACA
jgi:hypothetical protein